MNRITCAANVVRQDMSGCSVEQIRASMADVLNVPASVEAYVRGRRIGSGYRLRPNDCLEFIRTCGSKGANEARNCYEGSHGGQTRKLLSSLEKCGQLGFLAAQLFRIQKASSRAKVYRGGINHRDGARTSYRYLAYDKKDECIETLCKRLTADSCGMKWGWKPDPNNPVAPNVLYVETPNGQVSFHSPERYEGPDYPGEWDGLSGSEKRIVQFCQDVFDGGQDGRNQKQ